MVHVIDGIPRTKDLGIAWSRPTAPSTVCPQLMWFPAVYRFHQISDIVYRHKKQQQQQQEEDDQEGEEAQSVDMWLLQDSAMAQLMDPQLAALAVQFLVLEVVLLDHRYKQVSQIDVLPRARSFKPTVHSGADRVAPALECKSINVELLGLPGGLRT